MTSQVLNTTKDTVALRALEARIFSSLFLPIVSIIVRTILRLQLILRVGLVGVLQHHSSRYTEVAMMIVRRLSHSSMHCDNNSSGMGNLGLRPGVSLVLMMH
jgi:hypothetical protein